MPAAGRVGRASVKDSLQHTYPPRGPQPAGAVGACAPARRDDARLPLAALRAKCKAASDEGGRAAQPSSMKTPKMSLSLVEAKFSATRVRRRTTVPAAT